MARLSSDDAEILLWVHRRDFVTCKQLALYHAINISNANRRLLKLYKMGYLDRFKASESVADPYFYYLTQSGANIMCEILALDEQEIYVRRKRDAERLSLGYIEHTKGVNDFFTLLLYQSTKSKYPGLITWLNSRECKVELEDNEELLIPDGFGEFDNGQEVVQFMFEYDRETETMDFLMAKLFKYVTFCEEEIWKDYDLACFPRVLFLTQREKWAKNVKREFEIKARISGKEDLVRDNYFLFSWECDDHQENLLAANWLRASNGNHPIAFFS